VSVTILSGANATTGTLTATVPPGWTILGASPPAGASCQVAAKQATCSLPNPTQGQHRFVFTVTPPNQGASATMHVVYTDAAGTSTQELPL
jgi:hypothetical protein